MHASIPTTSANSPSTSAKGSTLALIALSVGSFGIGTTEFGPMGMLPTIAQGVDVSIPSAGMLVSAYAIGVTVGAPIMTLIFSRWAFRKALISLMVIFAVGNLLSAVAPNYFSLLIARIITSLTHGAYFGIGAVVAASLVPREKQGSAVAAMFLGLTIANIGGVPAASWIGQSIGWRSAFVAIASLGLIAMVALRYALPQGSKGHPPKVRSELKVLTRPAVIQAILTTVLSSGAMFSLYTYINPALETFTGASSGFITLALALVGVGFSIGNSVGGKLSDISIEKTLAGFLILTVVLMATFPWLARTPLGAATALVIWGISTFAVVPPIQMRVMRAAAEAPGLASSVNIGAFNFGNAIGAALGAVVLRANLGYDMVLYAGAALAALALCSVLWRPTRATQPIAECCSTCG